MRHRTDPAATSMTACRCLFRLKIGDSVATGTADPDRVPDFKRRPGGPEAPGLLETEQLLHLERLRIDAQYLQPDVVGGAGADAGKHRLGVARLTGHQQPP